MDCMYACMLVNGLSVQRTPRECALNFTEVKQCAACGFVDDL
jgi:hypothetical protein